jgi:multiple sugar transport system substrate-binding protein
MNQKRPALYALIVCGAGLFFFLVVRGGGDDNEKRIRLIGEAYAPLDALRNLKSKFEEETGITVEIVEKSHVAVVAELDQELTANQVSYDLILVPHRLLGKLVEKGHVREIDTFLATRGDNSTFDPGTELFEYWWREISCYRGKVYGFPFTCLSMYVAFRNDLLTDTSENDAFQQRFGRPMGPPKNWKQYLELAEFFNRPAKGMYGTYIQGKQEVTLWYEWLNMAYSFGGDVLDAPSGSEYGDIVINSPQNVEATKTYLKLLQFSPPEAVNYNADDALAALQQGRVFMGMIWHDQTPYLEDDTKSKVAGDMDYCLVPSHVGKPFLQLEGWTYLIPTKSKHTQEAYQFMEWAMRPDVQLRQTLAGGSSCMKSVYENKDVMAIPYVPTFYSGLSHGIPKPTFPESNQLTEVIQRGLSSIVTKQLSPKAGLDAIAREIKRVLGNQTRFRYPPEN